jgi:hypothetical protein
MRQRWFGKPVPPAVEKTGDENIRNRVRRRKVRIFFMRDIIRPPARGVKPNPIS